MKIRRFQAKTLKEALAQVKAEMGPDAIIVTTRNLSGGLLSGAQVEVTAAIDDKDVAATTPLVALPRESKAESKVPNIEAALAPVRAELRSLRGLVRSMSSDGATSALREELEAVRKMIRPLRRATNEEEVVALEDAAAKPITARSSARVTAIVGPTGVGKTTTIAKLAARAALVDRRSVAIINLDTYRVGGEAQMRTYADLIGVPMTTVADTNDFRSALRQHADADKIFVDTAGRSPRDRQSLSALGEAMTGARDLEVHLALAAGSTRATIDGWFERSADLGINRLLMTKVDEAEELDEIVLAPARLKTPVTYITTGQRVPEDIEEATRERLLSLANTGFIAPEIAA